ncbi:hypothetical protein K4X33_10445 [Brevibacterium casei]|nr:hypothetical protein K4X33_10445 [Brevibacterium casei]
MPGTAAPKPSPPRPGPSAPPLCGVPCGFHCRGAEAACASAMSDALAFLGDGPDSSDSGPPDPAPSAAS